jgi:4-alpha-glucanotransferase
LTERSGPHRTPNVHALARLYGVQTSYVAVDGNRVQASTEGLLAVLRALGAPVDGERDVGSALRLRAGELWRSVLEPATAAWDGRLAEVRIRMPATELRGPFRGVVTMEDGTERPWHATTVRVVRSEEVGGTEFVELAVAANLDLPFGYHRLAFTGGRASGSGVVIAAPLRAPQPEGRSWGVFLPLYSLRSSGSWGVGDCSDLRALSEWTAGLGGRWVATLPLLASFLGDGPLFDPSPYNPASRLFWNELFVDVTAVPAFTASSTTRELARSDTVRRRLRRARSSELVDYRTAMAAKREVLEALAREWPPGRVDARLDDYARFRAACERHGAPWTTWPKAEQDGNLPRVLGDAYRYHVFAQREAERQLGDVAGAPARPVFDLALGVSPAGYDVWRERDSFVLDASAGAPPDTFFAGGQDWGFPPLHPERIRRNGYRYVRDSLRHQMRHAGAVRIDHVMWMHRLYWVPRGAAATEGVYVRYPAEELAAVVALEAHRAGVVVIGEDLGTVPRSVRRSMGRHGVLRTFVLEMEISAAHGVGRPPRGAVATLNTHDLPPFAAFWRGADRRTREALIRSLRREGHLGRQTSAADVLRGSLRYLAASPAKIALVNLEDLWLDPRPQNAPGTSAPQNWRHRARLDLEGVRSDPDVVGTLREVDRIRRGRRPADVPSQTARTPAPPAARRAAHS